MATLSYSSSQSLQAVADGLNQRTVLGKTKRGYLSTMRTITNLIDKRFPPAEKKKALVLKNGKQCFW